MKDYNQPYPNDATHLIFPTMLSENDQAFAETQPDKMTALYISSCYGVMEIFEEIFQYK